MLLVEPIMLIIILVQLLGLVRLDERKYYFRRNSISIIDFFSASAAQRSQAQFADRHQIDDMEANNARSNTTASPVATPRTSTTNNTSDELGPLPPGWQMSKNENERMFFIDHINKRTTWVKK
jgi:hypothetical protein